MEADKRERERTDVEMSVPQHNTEEEKAEKELFEKWDPQIPVDVECEREEWIHVFSMTEPNLKLTSVPEGRYVLSSFPILVVICT